MLYLNNRLSVTPLYIIRHYPIKLEKSRIRVVKSAERINIIELARYITFFLLRRRKIKEDADNNAR